ERIRSQPRAMAMLGGRNPDADVFVDETGEVEVELRITASPSGQQYRMGQSVPAPDGIYVGERGAVAIREGRVALVTSHLHDDRGGWLEPKDILGRDGR